MSFWLNTFALFATLLAILIACLKRRYQYWQRRNVPFLQPRIPFGTSTNPFTRKENDAFAIKRQYNEMKSRKWKHGGLFMITVPVYLAVDLDYIKNILTKDFQYFTDRGLFYNEKTDPLSAHLFSLEGQKWRNLRVKLSPTFTSGKIKIMFQTLLDCIPNLLKKIDSDISRQAPIDIREVLGCFTTDIIGSCAFGLECNSFKDKTAPFREYGRKVFTFSPTQLLKIMTSFMSPKLALALSFSITPKDITNFFFKLVQDTIKYREKNNLSRNDFMQLLIELKNKPQDEALTMNEIVAQSFVFFFAGFETSSNTMTFALYELARNEEIQEKLRAEICKVLEKHNGEITYDGIQEMKFLEQVVNETLRLHPAVPVLLRKCVKDYKISDDDVIIEKDTLVFIPVLAIHHDEEFYPDPLKFQPERFTETNKSNRHSYAFLPFGEGPRICIGMRFGLLQTKVGLISLLKSYRFTVNGKTREPLRMKINSFNFSPEDDVFLDAEKM